MNTYQTAQASSYLICESDCALPASIEPRRQPDLYDIESVSVTF